MITKSYVESRLSYNHVTGLFVWRPTTNKTWNKRYAGTVAGTVKSDSGYLVISINKKPIKAHRLAILLATGVFPLDEVDHINGVRTDNRICNLRVVGKKANTKNKRLLRNNRSGYHGVFEMPSGRYRAKGWANNVQKHLGYFSTFDEAVTAKRKFESENGYHENHGVSA